ncbi:MAG: YihY family inner membrane protein [Myxococcales bacterium]|nr:YihY family inner membrane protein [Myxococcales bacterium]
MVIGPPIVQSRIDRFRHYWRELIWTRDHYPDGAPRALSRGVILVSRVLYVTYTGFGRERLRMQAAALTYVTLLSLVPALAVAFSLFTAFGGLEEVGARLKEFVIGALAVQQRDIVTQYLDEFVTSANAGQLGAIGTAFLFLTAIALLGDIERSFNDIWGVRRGRSLLERIQVYWPLVTAGPILLALSFSYSAALAASGVVQAVEDALLGFQVAGRIASYVVVCGFFAFLYQIVPNAAVRWQSAAIGGVFGGSLWLLAQTLYAIYAARAITYSAIYGSLSAVPLFIVWVWVSWVITLLGAAIAFAVQSARSYEPIARSASSRRSSSRWRPPSSSPPITSTERARSRGSGSSTP